MNVALYREAQLHPHIEKSKEISFSAWTSPEVDCTENHPDKPYLGLELKNFEIQRRMMYKCSHVGGASLEFHF